MSNVFIIHGSWGSPSENWFPWLKSELEKSGCRVFVPKFPTPKNQRLEIWLGILKRYDKHLDEDSIMIGHSMGCSLIPRKLELLNKSIKAAFLVGGFTKDLWNSKYRDILDTFLDKPFGWRKIKKSAKYFEIYQSDNDPYIPISMGREIAEKLGGKFIIVKNAGHFNEESGYVRFRQILENVKKTL